MFDCTNGTTFDYNERRTIKIRKKKNMKAIQKTREKTTT